MIAVAFAFVSSLLFFPAIFLNLRARLGILVVLVTAILLCPLLIPENQSFGRFLIAILAVTLSAKLFDLHLGAMLGHRPGLRNFLAFLPNLASIVLRKLEGEARPSRREDFARLLASSLVTAPGTLLFVELFWVDWRRLPVFVEHGVKVVAVFLTLVPMAAAATAAWRLIGGRACEPMDHPYAARTPAEFWRRYNRPAQQFFREDVFKPLGGLRSPIRATLGTFAVSAVLHEYIFAIAVGRVQGYQVAFFMIQGIAVAATLKVKPRGLRALPWVAATLAFNLASSAFFFASVDEVVPFYSRR